MVRLVWKDFFVGCVLQAYKKGQSAHVLHLSSLVSPHFYFFLFLYPQLAIVLLYFLFLPLSLKKKSLDLVYVCLCGGCTRLS